MAGIPIQDCRRAIDGGRYTPRFCVYNWKIKDFRKLLWRTLPARAGNTRQRSFFYEGTGRRIPRAFASVQEWNGVRHRKRAIWADTQ